MGGNDHIGLAQKPAEPFLFLGCVSFQFLIFQHVKRCASNGPLLKGPYYSPFILNLAPGSIDEKWLSFPWPRRKRHWPYGGFLRLRAREG